MVLLGCTNSQSVTAQTELFGRKFPRRCIITKKKEFNSFVLDLEDEDFF
jgi:hypothetical protein